MTGDHCDSLAKVTVHGDGTVGLGNDAEAGLEHHSRGAAHGIRPQVVSRKHLRDGSEAGSGARNALPEVPVFAGAKLLVEAAGLPDPPRANENRVNGRNAPAGKELERVACHISRRLD